MPSNLSQQGFGVIAAFGADRIGLLNWISSSVTDLGGNIERATVDCGGGQCVIFALVSGTADQLQLFENELPRLQSKTGLTVTFKTVHKPTVPEGMRSVPWKIRLQGEDFPGLLRLVTQLLVKHGMTILSYVGDKYVPQYGTAGFTQEFICLVPTKLERSAFLQDLQKLADDNGFSIVQYGPA